MSFGAIGPSPLASAPWQNRQFFLNAALPAAIDSAVDATGFFIFAASGLPCARADAVQTVNTIGRDENDTRRMWLGSFGARVYFAAVQNRWLPVVGGILMNLALGSLYAWSVFVPPLEREFGWTRAQTSWVYTIAIVCFALTFIFAGRLQDRKGPRICALLGGVLVSLGFVLASFTSSLAMLYVFYGVIVGIGNGFGYSTPMPVASKWFPDRRGLVVGLMVGGYGGGQAIFGTLASGWLVPSVGWRTTFLILGAIFFVMTMTGTLLIRNPPAGYRPPGWSPAQAAAPRVDFTTRDMLGTPRSIFCGSRTAWARRPAR